MGKIKTCFPVKYFSAITFDCDYDIDTFLNESITRELGTIDMQSEITSFSHFTDYYEKEMGSDLLKLFVSFSRLDQPDKLPDMKIKTNKLEECNEKEGKRRLNIDPGYLTQAKVVLATTKDYSHRIYLSRGIFGDLHLFYAEKSFRIQPWTYPDYQQPETIDFFNRLRDLYTKQLSGATIEKSYL
jgi:hypothetical protein